MTNDRRRGALLLATLLTALALHLPHGAAGQTPAPTPAAPAAPSPTPAPALDPEAKAFDEKADSLIKLIDAAQELEAAGTPESLASAEEKLNEVVETSRALYERLNDERLVKSLAPTGYTRADYRVFLKAQEIIAHGELGNVTQAKKLWRESERHFRRGLSVLREFFSDPELRGSKILGQLSASMRRQEAIIHSSIASLLYSHLNEPKEALEVATEGLRLARELPSDEKFRARSIEAQTLAAIGQIYLKLDDRLKVIEYYRQALSAYQGIPGQEQRRISLLSMLGLEHVNGMEYEDGFKYLNEALALAEKAGDTTNQAQVLSLLGAIQRRLGDEQKANEYSNRVLTILLSPGYGQTAKNLSPELAALARQHDGLYRLTQISLSYRDLNDYDKSLTYAAQALEVARSANDLGWTRTILSQIASTHYEKEDWPKAIEYCRRTIELSRRLPQKSNLAADLENLGFTQLEMKDWRAALQSANEALLIYKSLGAGEGNPYKGHISVLTLAARTQAALGNRRLAIFYGKQAVNAIQGERRQLQRLDLESQRGYLRQHEKPYRRLAEWLIAEGRIAEAERVLAMLKEDEYFNYLRRDDRVARELLDRMPLNRPEREVFERYEALADRVTSVAREFDGLEARRLGGGLTAEQQARWTELDGQLTDARKVFNAFLEGLDAKFRNPSTGGRDPRVLQVSATQDLLASLRQPRTVIISTIAGEDRLSLIVTTAQVNRAHTVELKAAELNGLVAAFRAAVMDPRSDPRPAGKRLYDKLFPADLRADIDNAGADTIVWSLDGALRYAPIAALWDGERYLAERYALSVLTLASHKKLQGAAAGRTKWTALGVGVSREVTVRGPDGTPRRFPALSAVPEELCGVVDDPSKRGFCRGLKEGPPGVLGGRNLADDEFTLRAFKLNLGKYPVVHVASHFSLNAGSESDSYLLLGGGPEGERKLTLAAVRDELGTKFVGTKLLTLSACNTLMTGGDKANGLEIESFGALAQNQGAESVLATLWAVADPSTRDLMVEFYRGLGRARGRTGRAVALRRAQLALLRGKYGAGDRPLWRRDVELDASGAPAPPFRQDAGAPYAHPYYWSPFVLLGNWN